MGYTIQYSVDGEFDTVVDSTVAALEDEGFGVLCDIDVQATLEEKLGADFRRYRILGACDPELAHEAMSEELELGALLPCNVVVYETGDGTVAVSAVSPPDLLSVVDNDDLAGFAEDVRSRLVTALDAVEANHAS